MAKTPALSTQLKTANLKIAELEKQLMSARQTSEYNAKQSKDASEMLEQVHQVLDAVPGSIARESEGENSWDRVKRSPVTRLAAWLAIRP
jgi:hypothetical protein